MRIGYACLTVGVPETGFKTCTQKYANPDALYQLIHHNLTSLEHIMAYNLSNNIRLFRISSDIIPFGSSPVNPLPWWDLFSDKLKSIGDMARSGGIRVSMHPGQYTVLNSPVSDVVKRSIEDLRYHTAFLDCLGADGDAKIILHVGGVYQDRLAAMARFVLHYSALDDAIKRRLVLENDDRSYPIEDILSIASKLAVPVVYDNLHNAILPSKKQNTDAAWIDLCASTWQAKDGPQKIHYAQQDSTKKPGAHSPTIRTDAFMAFYETIKEKNLDIMLEVKDKNLSALKCLHCITNDLPMQVLEREWAHYKYTVMERSQKQYLALRAWMRMREKSSCAALTFYQLIEQALKEVVTKKSAVNAVQHVWGYFKDTATEGEKTSFFKVLDAYIQGKVPLISVKRKILHLSIKYHVIYLLEGYYFSL